METIDEIRKRILCHHREEQRASNRKNLPLFGNRKNAGRRELTFRHRILGKVDISSCCD